MTILQTSGAIIGFVICLPFVMIWVVLAMIRNGFGRGHTAAKPLRANTRLDPIKVA